MIIIIIRSDEKDLMEWVWLQCCLGAASPKLHQVLKVFQSAENFMKASFTDIIDSGIFSQNELAKIKTKTFKLPAKILYDCKRLEMDIITFSDPRYPQRLRDISNPPAVLYAKGTIPEAWLPHIAMVGSRKHTAEAGKNAYRYAYDLAKNHFVVVSGGARGVDTQSHKGSLAGGGITICVLGGGINNSKHQAYACKEIEAGGLFVSEYPPDYPSRSYNFPRRDRIISGLSEGVLVVECGISSGSLITARAAVRQKRAVFAISSRDNNSQAEGSNLLIEKGAICASSYETVVKWHYNQIFGRNQELVCHLSDQSFLEMGRIAQERKKRKKDSVVYNERYWDEHDYEEEISELPVQMMLEEQQETENIILTEPQERKDDKISSEVLTNHAKIVYHTISDVPIHADEIVAVSGISPETVLSCLIELEVQGLIAECPGSRYVRK